MTNSTLKSRSTVARVHWPFPPLLKPFRATLDHLEVKDSRFAHWICRMIPAQCPFERDLSLWGRHLLSIPPLCKLNPLYEEVIALRFRALTFLAEDCQEDISCYIR